MPKVCEDFFDHRGLIRVVLRENRVFRIVRMDVRYLDEMNFSLLDVKRQVHVLDLLICNVRREQSEEAKFV